MEKIFTGILLLFISCRLHAQWNITTSPPNISFSGGKVGIGTTQPEALLHMSGPGQPGVGMMIEGTGDGYASTSWKSNGKVWNMGMRPSYEGNDFQLFYLGGTGQQWQGPYLSIAPNGSMGIGTMKTADASYKLFVETGIRTRKVVVDQAVWPDYVFKQGYTLPSLSVVAAYIKSHHHLPDMPSADSVARSGINLGDNQAQLLKKIEELTLYIISQDQTLRRQQDEITVLRQQKELIEALQRQMDELRMKL
jgi:hypothetical protein